MTENINEDCKQKPNFKLRKMYKFIKENVIINSEGSKAFIEKTQIFSIPIFYQMLFLFTIIKTFLSLTYFIFIQNIYFNFNMALILIQIVSSLLLTGNQTQQLKKISEMKYMSANILESIIKYTYIFSFCLEENMTIYYFEHFIFNMNPGFIFFILLLIVFYDLKTTKKFHEFMFYLYILNLVLLIYFLSIRNITNFFLPFNLVLSMFVLLNVISQNYHKKIYKMKVYHKFFEKLVTCLFKLNKNQLFVVYDGKIIYEDGDENTYTGTGTGICNTEEGEDFEKNRLSTEMSDLVSEYSVLEAKGNSEMCSIPIEDFKGFELTYKNSKFNSDFLYFNSNQIVSFINLLYYLKNPNATNGNDIKSDKKYLHELENIYNTSKCILKNIKLINLVERSTNDRLFTIRYKIITLIISFIFEASKFLCDEFLNNIFIKKNQIEFQFYKSSMGNEIYLKQIKSLYTFIEELSMCLNFKVEMNENIFTVNFEINNVIPIKSDIFKLIKIKNEEEFILDELKVMTPRILGK